jgi:hypothetical protein
MIVNEHLAERNVTNGAIGASCCSHESCLPTYDKEMIPCTTARDDGPDHNQAEDGLMLIGSLIAQVPGSACR